MSKRFTKLLCFIMVLFFTFTIMAGCRRTTDADKKPDDTDTPGTDDPIEEDEEDEEEITYDFGGRTFVSAAWWNSEPVEGASVSADETIERTKDLEEKFNCKLEYAEIPWDQYLENVTSTILAGEPFADYFFISSSWFWPTLVTGGFLLPLDDLNIFDFNDNKWNQAVIDLGTFEGKKYGITTGRPEPRGVFFWNKTMFEREQLPNLYELQKSGEWTWDKMLEIAKKVTKDLDGDGVMDQWGLPGGGNIGWQLVFSNGGQDIKQVDGKSVVALNEPAAIEGLQYWQDLIHVHKVLAPAPEGAEWGWDFNMFKDGKAAMLFGDFWLGDQFGDMEDDYGIVLPPKGPRVDTYVSKAWDNVMQVIPSSAKKPEEIAIFYDAMTEPLPSSGDPQEAWITGWEGRVRDRESLESLIPIRDNTIPTMFQKWEYISELQQMGWSFMYSIEANEKTPQVAIDEIVQQAQAILDDVANK